MRWLLALVFALGAGACHAQTLQNFSTGSAAARACSDSVPAAAASAGYNTETFCTNTFTTSNVDIAVTQNPGYQWYFSCLGGVSGNASDTTINGDGTISIGKGASAHNVASATCLAGSPFFRGTAYGGGFYIEATLKFPAFTGAPPSYGWPALWFKSIESYTNPPTSNHWPGQVASYIHYFEADIMEYNPTFTSQTQTRPGALDWYGPNASQLNVAKNQLITPSGGNTIYHTYGFLWIPATALASGSITFYLDNVSVETYSYTQFDCVNGLPGPPPTSGGATLFGIIDCQHAVMLMVGEDATNALTVKNYHIFQASAAGNVSN